ncbi:hypothetical protein SAMN04515656_104113 [Eubacterium aggregans]|uniref:Uncharacterized protein n=1 Tax=Eubacterium aggregans TaxID=81409 RepID=A0A1H3YTZ4_9FIRM|nr:hypothetical protein [Eubacterium aggregans]SEA15023.1 hypothetical protein SAMN04515656_104113 [Eubacterium aggregans]
MKKKIKELERRVKRLERMIYRQANQDLKALSESDCCAGDLLTIEDIIQCKMHEKSQSFNIVK